MVSIKTIQIANRNTLLALCSKDSITLKYTIMKPLILLLSLLISAATFATPIKIDERVQKSFATAFPYAQSVKWYGNETHYEVLFFYGDVHCRITYRLDGTIERSERYYTQEALAPFVKTRIQQKYAGYRIHGVTEVTTDAGLVYYIVLEGTERWLQVQADETGAAYIIKRFKTQKPAGAEQPA